MVILLVLVAVGATGAFGAAKDADRAESAVRDYEERIEEVAKEIQAIRRDLEALTREMVEGETGRVFIFLSGKASKWSKKGVSVELDGADVFSRPLTDSELDVLGRDLPLELLEIRLGAGPHTVLLTPIGKKSGEPEELIVKRGEVNSWIAKTEGKTVQWDVK